MTAIIKDYDKIIAEKDARIAELEKLLIKRGEEARAAFDSRDKLKEAYKRLLDERDKAVSQMQKEAP